MIERKVVGPTGGEAYRGEWPDTWIVRLPSYRCYPITRYIGPFPLLKELIEGNLPSRLKFTTVRRGAQYGLSDGESPWNIAW